MKVTSDKALNTFIRHVEGYPSGYGNLLSLTMFISRYDEEQALADAREREVKSRAGQRGKGKDVKKQVTWK